MNLPLVNPRARIILLLGCCALALFLGFFAIRNAVSAHYLGQDTRQGYERAVRLEPSHARNWYLLGRSYLYDLEQPDPARAVEALRKAAELDPYSAEALLDLANAYEGEGEVNRARAALVSARRVYPESAEVAWSYGNFLLRQGEQDAAFAQLHKALELDPRRAGEAFTRALRVQSDPNVILDKVVPPSPETYVPILQVLSATGDLETGETVLNRMVALHRTVPMREMVQFFGALIRAKRPADAARLWPLAVSVMQDAPPPDPPGSLLWDGGFESAYSGGGFSWHFLPVRPDVRISFDAGEKHSGQRSLRILFNGQENIAFTDVCHDFVPEPGRSYLLTGWVKTQSLTSSEGVRLQISAYSAAGNKPVESEEVHGTQTWTQIRLPWTAPQDSGFGHVCVVRKMSAMPGSAIQGALWLDDVIMVPADQAAAQP